MAVKCDSNLILSNYGTLHAKLYTTLYCTWLSFNWIVFNRLKNAFISHTLTYSTHLMVKNYFFYFLFEGRRTKEEAKIFHGNWINVNEVINFSCVFLLLHFLLYLTTIKSDNIYLWSIKKNEKDILLYGVVVAVVYSSDVRDDFYLISQIFLLLLCRLKYWMLLLFIIAKDD